MHEAGRHDAQDEGGDGGRICSRAGRWRQLPETINNAATLLQLCTSTHTLSSIISPPTTGTMAASPSSFPTFQDYTFDLASRLQAAASQSLKEFEASITRDGFDWLEGYLENLEAQDRRPIAELIKTPSRTHTVKKTRHIAAAAETAARDRAEQIRQFNARIALSPLMMSPEVSSGAYSQLTTESPAVLTPQCSAAPRLPVCIAPQGQEQGRA